MKHYNIFFVSLVARSTSSSAKTERRETYPPSQHQQRLFVPQSNGQIGVSPTQSYPVSQHANIRSDNRDPPRKSSNGAYEISEQNSDSVEFNYKSDERPAYQNQYETNEEGCRAFGLLFPRKEEERLLGTDDDGETDEEENLRSLVLVLFSMLFSSTLNPCVRGSMNFMGGMGRSSARQVRTFPMASLSTRQGRLVGALCSLFSISNNMDMRDGMREILGARVAYMARSNKSITPPMRKRPPSRDVGCLFLVGDFC